ncbi:MAG: phage tail sheath C-terminal domain-containing protein [Planctomycetota bacterium]
MAEYLSPGVYVEEVSTGPKPIEGVSTSVAGFLGPTERGPEDIHYISSWLEFKRLYGNHLGTDNSFMSYAVQGFFDNGGKRCFVGRIVGNGSATAVLNPTAPGNVEFRAYGGGTWGNNVFVRVVESTKSKNAKVGDAAKGWVRVQVLYFSEPVAPEEIADPFNSDKANDKKLRRPDVPPEDFDDLSLSTTAANSFITVINAGSRLIRVTATGAVPAVVTVAADAAFTPLQGGVGGLPTVNDYAGNLDPNDDQNGKILGSGRGLAAMDTIDAVSLLVAPDHVRFGNTLAGQIITSCENLKDRFAILSTDRNFNVTTPQLQFDTTFGALYHPWIWVYDTVTREDQLVPPTGHVAGIIARTDIEQGVWKAPANAVVVDAKDLMSPIPKAVQDLLNPIGVNCIRDFRSDRRGIRLWGARTMSSDPEWKYINVRRLFLYIEESIDEGTQWVVFEPNNEVTWGRVQRSISNFLMTIWRNGGLFGSKPEEAFFVRCDRTTMSEDDIENGRLVCQIGVCPVRPAEFVIFRIGQKTADATA